MNAKADRKSLLRSSIKSETASVEKRFDPQELDKRYEAAEDALAGRPLGLAGPRLDASLAAADLRAEIGASSDANAKVIIRIPIDKAHDNPFNARQIYDPETVKSLAASLATRGQLVAAPAITHPSMPGHYLLIDGHYRKRALLAAGKTEIECVVHDVSDELDMYRMSYLINEERNAQSPLDNALAWQKLLDEAKVADGEGIAELIGISPAAVAKTMALLKMPQSALDKMREYPTKFGVAIGYEVYRISKIVAEKELLDLMERVVKDDLSSRALEQVRAKLEEAKPRKKKEVSRQYRINSGPAQIGFIKEWDSGKVAFEVNLADPKEREALVDELKRRFNLSENH
ncbi:ParB/RepB/Spo0J family partition protein [Noviherbaspirillum pedocola]|uniref:ParB/RepB/Spo0J family partition protein n=1 Tax=Noviherbaspirillum pedocola TaxID=2801341 RepID=A0A934WAI5_9BURK|nr:ParB/RepB/Spo0J family partition protein [Noviherbaspirillum pedocola]MBK4739089.1 ParB/RepB/Spo0J family partition protein [Noviherbaspirillum pedocola]